jgi:phage repressor protein C with HTH and peptisase S24 domain
MGELKTIQTVGDRIRAERQAKGVSRNELAQYAGLAYSTLADLENNKSGGTTVLHKIAERLGVRPNWLATGKGPKEGTATALDEDWADILGVRQAVALGPGAEPDEYAETHKLKFRADSLMRKHLRPERLAVVYGKGDSMYPTIKDGDAILIDTGDREPKDEKLFVVTYGRDLLAKRLINLGGRWFIDSDNKADPQWRRPVPVDETKGFEIHGRVRWIGSWED